MNEKQVGLASQAYKGAPKGVAHVWPDEVNIKPAPHWSWDSETERLSKLSEAGLRRERIKKLTKMIIDTM